MTDPNDSTPPADDFASMLAEYDREHPTAKKSRGPRVGDHVKGRVVSIGAASVFVDLGGKSEGVLDGAEVRDAETGEWHVKIGDELEAIVTSIEEGQVILRRKLGRGKDAHAELQQAFEAGIPVEGVVTSVNKGGVEVQIAGARAFCPISQLEMRHVENAAGYVGQKLTFRITRYESAGKGRENIVVSRRALLEEEGRARADKMRDSVRVGAVLRGTVTTLKDYGAFVDLGGLEGMLHISELGFTRVAHPKDVLHVGQSVEVQVLKMEQVDDPRRPDQKHDKISLSLKSLEKDPWSDAAERFPEGAKLPGKVARVEQFGAFVELAPGIEGLVHISELGGGKNVKHARQMAKAGDTVEVVVLGVDSERRRISLSLASVHGDGDADVPMEAGRAPAKSFGTFGDLLKGGGKKQK